jgi:hypothetical protein
LRTVNHAVQIHPFILAVQIAAAHAQRVQRWQPGRLQVVAIAHSAGTTKRQRSSEVLARAAHKLRQTFHFWRQRLRWSACNPSHPNTRNLTVSAARQRVKPAGEGWNHAKAARFQG